MQCPRHTPVPELKQYIVWNTHLLSCSWKPPRYGGWSDIMFLKPNWSILTSLIPSSIHDLPNLQKGSAASQSTPTWPSSPPSSWRRLMPRGTWLPSGVTRTLGGGVGPWRTPGALPGVLPRVITGTSPSPGGGAGRRWPRNKPPIPWGRTSRNLSGMWMQQIHQSSSYYSCAKKLSLPT